MTLPSLSGNEIWCQIWINNSKSSTLRNLVLIVIPNHFEKHTNRTSEIKIVIYKKYILLEKNKLLSKQKDVASTFNKHFGSLTDLLKLLVYPKILHCHQWMTQVTPLLKKLSFAKYKNNKQKNQN